MAVCSVLQGELDAEGGALVKTALDALSAPAGPADERHGSQRRADALVELASCRLRDGTLLAAHGQRPHLTVTADVATLRRLQGADLADVQGMGPVHAETARRVACDSVLTVASIAGNGEPMSIGRPAARSRQPSAQRSGVATVVCRFPVGGHRPGRGDGSMAGETQVVKGSLAVERRSPLWTIPSSSRSITP